jgi:hypothetical protein
MLDRGVETSQAFKQIIADFLGVPTKEDLRMMRQAWTNMTYPPCNSMDASDREEAAAMEEDMATILGARRQQRWERRLELERAERNGDGAERMERFGDRFGRAAAVRERLLVAHRRGAAAGMFAPPPLAEGVIHLNDDDEDEDEERGLPGVDIVVNFGPPVARPPIRVGGRHMPPPPPHRPANGNMGNGNGNGPPPRDRELRDHFFAMLEEWDDQI